jgi:hypothetical protein
MAAGGGRRGLGFCLSRDGSSGELPTRVCVTEGLGRVLTCRNPDQRAVRDQSLSQIPLLSRPYDRDLAVGICTIAAVYNIFAAEPLELSCITIAQSFKPPPRRRRPGTIALVFRRRPQKRRPLWSVEFKGGGGATARTALDRWAEGGRDGDILQQGGAAAADGAGAAALRLPSHRRPHQVRRFPWPLPSEPSPLCQRQGSQLVGSLTVHKSRLVIQP